ncbi:MAG: SPOR domain-containing protein [Gammaproteobacteria bacterium]|nr:SPOR domain-containing protein [Gammaproteobacteria bacterium]
MTDENKPDAIDDGDDLLSDFNDLFPEESDDDALLNELDADDDDLDSLLDGLNSPTEVAEEPAEESPAQESVDELDDLDALLDDLDSSINLDSESEEETAEPAESADAPDDLDALLDDMEGHVDEIISDETPAPESEDDIDSMLDDLVADSEPSPERELDIDENELDLSVDIDEPEEIAAAPAEEEPVESMLDDLISDDEEPFAEEEPELVVAAEPASVAEIEAEEEPAAIPDEPRAEVPEPAIAASESPKSSSMVGTILVSLFIIIALGAGGGGVWLALEAQKAAQINNSKITKLQKENSQLRMASESTYNPIVDQNSSSIRDLDLRINELSRMVDGPLSHMDANANEEVIGKLEERLQQLEQRIAELKVEMEKRPTVVATATAPPLVTKVAETAKKPAQGWALNLLSLSSREGANSEVNRLQKAGVNASRDPFTTKDGKIWYRVRVTGFGTYDEAKAYAKTMPKLKGISDTWVTKE